MGRDLLGPEETRLLCRERDEHDGASWPHAALHECLCGGQHRRRPGRIVLRAIVYRVTIYGRTNAKVVVVTTDQDDLIRVWPTARPSSQNVFRRGAPYLAANRRVDADAEWYGLEPLGERRVGELSEVLARVLEQSGRGIVSEPSSHDERAWRRLEAELRPRPPGTAPSSTGTWRSPSCGSSGSPRRLVFGPPRSCRSSGHSR